MKQIKFTYTKSTGEVSNRTGVVLHKPTPNFLLVDLSEYIGDEVEMNYMLEQVKQYETELKQLQARYSISSHCKAFKPDCMSNTVYE